MKFQTSTEGLEIHSHFKLNKLLQKECEFMCYSDSMFVYHLKISDGIFYEIIFEVDGDLFPKEVLLDLLNKNRIGYFSVTFFNEVLGQEPNHIGVYNKLDTKHLN
jgi:hypothetical protein